MTTTPQDQQRAARIELDDDSAVVVIGSGAGGGTLAHELTEKGVVVMRSPRAR